MHDINDAETPQAKDPHRIITSLDGSDVPPIKAICMDNKPRVHRPNDQMSGAGGSK